MELVRDLAFGIRLLRKRPGFTVAAALALALAIGATTTISAVGISAHDPLAFGVSAFVLVATALAAGYFPARRDSRVDHPGPPCDRSNR